MPGKTCLSQSPTRSLNRVKRSKLAKSKPIGRRIVYLQWCRIKNALNTNLKIALKSTELSAINACCDDYC